MIIFEKIWNSPTFTTWASFLSKSANIILITPLVLNRFKAGDVNYWYFTSIILSLLVLLDSGFGSAFVRIIAYGSFKNIAGNDEEKDSTQDYLKRINGIMRGIYKILSIISLVILSTFGTWLLIDIINKTTDYFNALVVWVCFVVTFPYLLWGNIYLNLLQGVNLIPLVRRWDTLFNLISTSSIVIYIYAFQSSIFNVILINQFWLIIAVVRNSLLVKNKFPDINLKSFKFSRNDEILKMVVPSALKSGFGILLSQGVVQSSAFIYGQIASPQLLGSYLVGLNLIQNIRNFSQAPFYSRIPLFSSLYSKGEMKELAKVSIKNMNLVYYFFTFFVLLFSYFSDIIFKIIHSHVDFPSKGLWSLLGIAFLIERYGAMHLQVYSTTNKIIWHYLNGITGVLMIISSVLLFKYVGVMSFPIGMIIGYLLCYSWYAPYKSYQLLNVNPLKFEIKGIIPCIIILVINFLALELL
ncbi:lipopolysaccharide biosynthesis protein [Arcicella rigui]|uniref:Polysaccharide biosynthesis protein n=1 Tax=Arcicella rigui TaxID=797020 RepID=A0ABU5Q9L7_9BACT|nr:hypothetical protein [Arcicella rigui]MEA5139287.1 hypothetical protein [Arcicella rigui]